MLSESKIIELNNGVYTVTREGCALYIAGVGRAAAFKEEPAGKGPAEVAA